MSRHDDRDEETAPNRAAFEHPEEEPTGLYDYVPDDLRRSAAIVLGDEADAEDMTAPTRVRDDDLRAAIAASMSTPAQIEESTQVNISSTAGQSRPPALDNPFSEDEPTQAQVFRTSELDAIARGAVPAAPAPAAPAYEAPAPAAPAPAAPARPPAHGGGNPFSPQALDSNRFGASRPYDSHQPNPGQSHPHASPHAPANSGRVDPTRPRPKQHADGPVGLAAEKSWSSHVDDSPIVRPRSGPPTGFGPAVTGPTRHPGAPVDKGDMSHDTLIKQQLADHARPLTEDERDSVTNNMLIVGITASFVVSFMLLVAGASTIFLILAFIVITAGVGAISRKYPEPCESFLNVLNISVRAE